MASRQNMHASHYYNFVDKYVQYKTDASQLLYSTYYHILCFCMHKKIQPAES